MTTAQSPYEAERFIDDADEYDEEVCDHCHGDTMDPDCDYLLPCPVCN